MTVKDIFHMCLQNLMRRRARTFLTVLGVIIGCCSIVIMVSIGIGMKVSQERMLAEMGDLTIITVMPPQDGKGKTKLNDASVETFLKLSNVTAASPKLGTENYSIKLYAGSNNRYVCEWTMISALDMEKLPELGYNILEGDIPKNQVNGVLAGQYMAFNFADTMRPEGSNTVNRYEGMDFSGLGNQEPAVNPYFDVMKTELIMEIDTGNEKINIPLTPVGRIKEDYSKGYETSEGLIMNLSDLKGILEQVQAKMNVSKPITYQSALVKVSDISKVAAVEKEIKAMGFHTSSMESIRRPMEKEAKQKQMMLGGLGAISLFVAALGITNTMIMSISERTREIGIMKSLGCFVNDIRVMFLLEAGMIGFIGGLSGCIISGLASLLINVISAGAFTPDIILGLVTGQSGAARLSIIPPWLFLFAIVFSIAIGLGSGYYPADKAVKIPALEAIKSE